MLALSVEFLTGRFVAASFDDRGVAEWPPHPMRLFSALAAAAAEGGDKEGRTALEWLEQQDPPGLAVGEHFPRTVMESYVPVNDSADPARVPATGEGFPLGRVRQPRTFPSGVVEPPVACFIWEKAEPTEETLHALAHLADRVSYLGHSSSLVAVRLTDAPLAPNLVPVGEAHAEVVLRVPRPGQLQALEEAHLLYVGRGVRGVLPCGFQGYGSIAAVETVTPRTQTVFAEMVVFRRQSGPQLPITAASSVAAALRGAVMAASADPSPEILSGHGADGGPSERPHLAFVALPDVGHRHADGHLLGAAVVLPQGLDLAERRTVLTALSAVDRLTMGRVGAWTVERGSGTQRGLRPELWKGPSKTWASVTPVELDIHPDEPCGSEAEESVTRSCERIGLPRPSFVLVAPQSVVFGVPPWHAFRRDPGHGRPLVHVVLGFDRPVRGPLLLGAGRYRGLGLCRPMPGRAPTQSDES